MGNFSLKAKPPPTVSTHCFPANIIFFWGGGYDFFTAKLQTDSIEMKRVVEGKNPDNSLNDASCDLL